MGWRDKYKVHPAADVFPMMPDDELVALGEDIKKNGQTIPVLFWNGDGRGAVLIDGRNRLEACERVGVSPLIETFTCKDPVTHIITLNIRRRHLTKQQQADLIVAAIAAGEKPRQDGEVSKGGQGKKNELKEKAVAVAAEHGIGERTVERAIAKADGKEPRKAESEIAEPDPGFDVEYPEHVLVNALDTIAQAKAVAEAYRKIFKRSSFDAEAKEQLRKAIKQLIVKWRTADSALDGKKPCRKCHGTGTIVGKKTGMKVDCDCVR